MPEQRPLAAVVVRNTASHDARVLRCARALRSLGYESIVLAVTSEEESEERAVLQGVPVVRLTPRAPFAALVRRLRGRTSGAGSEARTVAGPAPADDGAGRPRLATRTYRLLRTLSYYRRGIGAIRRLRPRLIHCNDYNTMWIGVAAKLLVGSALVYDSHELWADRNGRTEPRWWLLACEALFLRLADRTLATSPGHAEEIARRHRVAPPLVVRNVAERPGESGSPASPELAGGDAARTVVYSGAITANRGLEQAIEALPLAPGVRLRALGPGSPAFRRSLAAAAADRGVVRRFHLEDPVAPGRVVAEIVPAAAGLALIQPSCLSYALSLPNKLFEYLAAGLPILAADVPTIRDFVEDNGVGLVVPPADAAAIAAALEEIVEPERNRALRAGVEAAMARFSWTREAERLKDAYSEAVAAR